jgi:hypothetical protein
VTRHEGAEGVYTVTSGQSSRPNQVVWNVGKDYVLDSFVGSGSYAQVVRAHFADDAAKTVVIKCTPDIFKVSVCILPPPPPLPLSSCASCRRVSLGVATEPFGFKAHAERGVHHEATLPSQRRQGGRRRMITSPHFPINCLFA